MTNVCAFESSIWTSASKGIFKIQFLGHRKPVKVKCSDSKPKCLVDWEPENRRGKREGGSNPSKLVNKTPAHQMLLKLFFHIRDLARRQLREARLPRGRCQPRAVDGKNGRGAKHRTNACVEGVHVDALVDLAKGSAFDPVKFSQQKKSGKAN